MTEHGGNLVVVTSSPDRIYEITDLDDIAGATNLGTLPSDVGTPSGIASYAGSVFIINTSDQLWKLTNANNPSSATNEGALPTEVATATGATAHNVQVEVRYTPVEPIVATAEDTAGQTANGVYARTFRVRRTSLEEAQETADVHLRRYSVLVHHIGYGTYERGARTGQALTVNRTTPAVSGTFVIDYVGYTDVDGKNILCEVRASDAEGDNDWKELWAEDTTGEIVDAAPVYDADGNQL